jgi:UDP-N-acetylglucosamine 2-epimerase (non-hydrolysing)
MRGKTTGFQEESMFQPGLGPSLAAADSISRAFPVQLPRPSGDLDSLPGRVMFVFGTRPEAIKLGPVIAAIDGNPLLSSVSVVTGQHRDLLKPLLDLFGIHPDVDLAIMSERQTLTDITVRSFERITPVIAAESPDAVVVQGDTTAAMVGAVAAFYANVPVVHLEAGLRTNDLGAPFPEEFNRRVISIIASLHLVPTLEARENLLRESTDPYRIVVVGNTVIDALFAAIKKEVPYDDGRLEALHGDPRRVILVTAHRRESWGEPMHDMATAIATIAQSEPGVVIALPMHPNPQVRGTLMPLLEGLDNVILCEPLAYGPFARLIARADLILTDSGGLQEEGPALGKPVLVMRETTERPEGVAAGSVRLVGTRSHDIVHASRSLLHDADLYRSMAVPRLIYGDGFAADRAVTAIANRLGLGAEPDEFVSEWDAAQVSA